MDNNLSPRETLLNDAFKTWFNSRYQELISSELLEKWQLVDTFAQIGIALAASGSAVAGWQLWEKPAMKVAWAVISGAVSIVALCHKGFRVTDKIRIWSESKKAFTMLRNQLEILRYEVDASFGRDRKSIDKRYLEIKKSYADEDAKTPARDLWLTKSFGEKIVSEVYKSPQQTNYEEELKRSRDKYITTKGGTNV
jgi:hypothetical protein